MDCHWDLMMGFDVWIFVFLVLVSKSYFYFDLCIFQISHSFIWMCIYSKRNSIYFHQRESSLRFFIIFTPNSNEHCTINFFFIFSQCAFLVPVCNMCAATSLSALFVRYGGRGENSNTNLQSLALSGEQGDEHVYLDSWYLL